MSLEKFISFSDFPGGSDSKECTCNAGDQVQVLGQKYPLEKELETNSSILAWRIPWTEKPGRLQSVGSQRTGHNCMTNIHLSTYLSCLFWGDKFVHTITTYSFNVHRISSDIHSLISEGDCHGLNCISPKRFLAQTVKNLPAQRSKQTFLQRRHTDG